MKLKKNNFKIIEFCVTYIFFIVVSCVYNVTKYPWDSSYYWTVADSVFSSGKFDICLFPNTFRGCIFPVFIGCIRRIIVRLNIPEYWAWRLLVAFLCSVMFSILLPCIFGEETKYSKSIVIRKFLVIFIFVLYWGDFIQYPLSDIPAIVLFFTGVVCLEKSQNEKKIHSLLFLFIAGILFYVTYNTRVIYIYAIGVTIIIYCIRLIGKTRFSIFLVNIACIVIGFIICGIPQSLVNNCYNHSIAPIVMTNEIDSEGKKLELVQLYWGINYDRYETFIGNEDEYYSPSVFFDDVLGQQLLKNEDITYKDFTIDKYVMVVLKHPIDIMLIYVRHAVSLLSPIFNQVYITSFYNINFLLVSIHVFIWILSINIIVITKNKKQKINDYNIYAVTGCIPVALEVLGAVEVRFALILYIYIYYIFFMKSDLKFKKRKTISGLLIIVCYILWMTIISDIMGNCVGKTILF